MTGCEVSGALPSVPGVSAPGNRAGPPEMFAAPSIRRRYHSPRLSPSIDDFVNVSTPDGKCPHIITEWLHTLRTRSVVMLAASVGSADGPDSSGCSR